MQSAEALDLPVLPVDSAELAADPLPFFEAARRQHPWLARSRVGYTVTEYQAMKDILYRDDKLKMPNEQMVAIMGAEGTGWGRFTNEMMLSRSDGEHARLRGSVAEAFTPRAINRLRPVIRQVVGDLLDEWAPKGAFDFAEFAAQFPVKVMFRLIGADPALLPEIRAALEVQGASFALQPERMPEIEAAYQQEWAFVDRLIAERGPSGGHGDLLDDLIAANTSGAINDVELRQMLIFLFAAGYDTSKNQLTLIMNAMLRDPAKWARCAEERAYCDKVVDEALRYTSPANNYRTVVEDLEYRDVVLPKGAMLFFPLGISGRDPTAFDQPDVFDPEHAQPTRHIAFGRGMHICLGQYLARAQLEEGLHLIAQRLAQPRLAGEVTWRPFPGVWGIRELPIVFDPAPRRAEPADAASAPAGCPVAH